MTTHLAISLGRRHLTLLSYVVTSIHFKPQLPAFSGCIIYDSYMVMAARSLGLFAAFGLAANAFLLPPPISTDSTNTGFDLSTWILVDPNNQPLLVPCTGCELDGTGPKNLFLNISTGSQPGTLELGGKTFYPPVALLRSGLATEPTALAVPTGKSIADVMAEPESYISVPISFESIFSRPRPQTLSEHGEELLEMTLHIDSVSQRHVSVPKIELQVLKDPEARMMILSSKWVEDEREVARPEVGQPNQPACESPICQWRQFIQNKIHGVSSAVHSHFGNGRPCSGTMGKGMMKDGKPHGPFTNLHHGPGSHHHRPVGEAGRPHHHHGHPKPHHGHHHHHHGFHNFVHRVGRFIMAVAIPILIGVAAGAVTYAVGMIVGCVIALVWIKLFRGGKRGYASLAQTESDADGKQLGSEAESRESFESAPPVYEDAPAYEEKEVA